jgi:hypothetical protein
MKKTLLIFLLFTNQFCSAQSACFGILQDSLSVFHSGYVNMWTGEWTSFAPVTTFTQTVLGASVLNQSTNQYSVRTRNNGIELIHTFDAYSGALYTYNSLNDEILNLNIHPVTDVVYGIWYETGIFKRYFVTLDMITCQKTVLDTLNGIGYIQYGGSFINSLTNQYVCLATHNFESTYNYITIDLTSGAIVNDVPPPDTVSLLTFHPVTGMVYGIWHDASDRPHLVNVNTTTGQKTVLMSFPTLNNVYLETFVLNPFNNQISFRGVDSTGLYDHYYTVDLNTNTLIHEIPATDRLANLQFSNLLTSVFTPENNTKYNSFPNPFNQSVLIQFDNNNQENFTLTVYDQLGKIVRNITDIRQDHVVIEKQDMSSGLYHFQLSSSAKSIKGKLIVE